MSLAKLAVIIGSAVVIVGGAVGIVWWLRSRSVPSASGQPAPGTAVELVAPPVTGSLRTESVAATGEEPPSEIPEEGERSIEELKRIRVYPGESRGFPGEEPAVTMADLLRVGGQAATEETAPGVFVIPVAPSAGTGGGSAVPRVEGSADPDKDGLTNDQELQQGTDPNKADTDGDGLTDGDEVRKYRTDPLNSDTDGDTYQYGAEVKAGYNPRGSGKL